MNELPIEAQICESTDGPFYQVRLQTVPRVGELIDLTSHIDLAAKHPQPRHLYEVVQIVHKMYDVADEIPVSKRGYHLVSVFVKPSQSGFLESSSPPLPPNDLN
jgi:hypothetical protein